MTLYQKFLDLTGLVHISEADFNAALDPKTDEQKALHDFIGWSVGKTDANPEAAAFRTAIGNSNKEHKADVTDTVLSSPTAPTSETVDTTHTRTVTETSTTVTHVTDTVLSSLTVPDTTGATSENHNDTVVTGIDTHATVSSPTAPETVASEDHKADVHDTVVTSLTAPDTNVVTSSETESTTGEPSTLVVK